MPRDCSFGANAIVAFDVWNELTNDEIFVAHLAVARIDVESAVAIGRRDQELANCLLVTQILYQIHDAGLNQGLLVVADTMQKIKDWVDGGFIRVVVRGKDHAVPNRVPENLARNRTAFCAAGARCGQRHRRQNPEADNQGKSETEPGYAYERPGADVIHT